MKKVNLGPRDLKATRFALPLPFFIAQKKFSVAFSIAHIFHFYFAVALPVFVGKAIFGRRFPKIEKHFAINFIIFKGT